MNKLKCFILLYVISTCLYSETEFNGVWKGIEIAGCNTKESKLIREIIPIKQGSNVSETNEEMKKWCKNLEQKLNLRAKCGIVGYLNGDIYYAVETLKPAHVKFRKIDFMPLKSLIPKKINILYADFYKNLFDVFKNHAELNENWSKGYLDYANHQSLHDISEKLHDWVSHNNYRVLYTLSYAVNDEERAKAAMLLSWSSNPHILEYSLKHHLFDNYDGSVRNNLMRAIINKDNFSKNKKFTKNMIALGCNSISFPFHCDKNKGLVLIKKILESDKASPLLIRRSCLSRIKELSQSSILPNVGQTASEILELIDKSEFK